MQTINILKLLQTHIIQTTVVVSHCASVCQTEDLAWKVFSAISSFGLEESATFSFLLPGRHGFSEGINTTEGCSNPSRKGKEGQKD